MSLRKQKTPEDRKKEIRFNTHVGTRLRNLRCKHGYSQTNLADELKVTLIAYLSYRFLYC